ncbi:MAG: phosphoribosylformylglycinamidine synthase I [Patescibacteria group bacterium]
MFAGFGLNCEEEAAYGFTLAGAKADIVHLNDVIDGRVKLKNYHILAFPGGFAYGDDTGAGKAYGNRVRNHLMPDLKQFIADGKLVIGICNGFQILAHAGILPGMVTFNDSNRYSDRWVDMKVEGESPWLKGIKTLSAPIAHGEGKYVGSKKLLADLKKNKQVALRYVKGEMARYQNLPANPNGSMEDIAGVLAHEGRVFGLMPHPDRALFPTQLPNWNLTNEKLKRSGKKLPKHGPGIQIFRNGVAYFHGR